MDNDGRGRIRIGDLAARKRRVNEMRVEKPIVEALTRASDMAKIVLEYVVDLEQQKDELPEFEACLSRIADVVERYSFSVGVGHGACGGPDIELLQAGVNEEGVGVGIDRDGNLYRVQHYTDPQKTPTFVLVADRDGDEPFVYGSDLGALVAIIGGVDMLDVFTGALDDVYRGIMDAVSALDAAISEEESVLAGDGRFDSEQDDGSAGGLDEEPADGSGESFDGGFGDDLNDSSGDIPDGSSGGDLGTRLNDGSIGDPERKLDDKPGNELVEGPVHDSDDGFNGQDGYEPAVGETGVREDEVVEGPEPERPAEAPPDQEEVFPQDIGGNFGQEAVDPDHEAGDGNDQAMAFDGDGGADFQDSVLAVRPEDGEENPPGANPDEPGGPSAESISKADAEQADGLDGGHMGDAGQFPDVGGLMGGAMDGVLPEPKQDADVSPEPEPEQESGDGADAPSDVGPIPEDGLAGKSEAPSGVSGKEAGAPQAGEQTRAGDSRVAVLSNAYRSGRMPGPLARFVSRSGTDAVAVDAMIQGLVRGIGPDDMVQMAYALLVEANRPPAPGGAPLIDRPSRDVLSDAAYPRVNSKEAMDGIYAKAAGRSRTPPAGMTRSVLSIDRRSGGTTVVIPGTATTQQGIGPLEIWLEWPEASSPYVSYIIPNSSKDVLVDRVRATEAEMRAGSPGIKKLRVTFRKPDYTVTLVSLDGTDKSECPADALVEYYARELARKGLPDDE